MKLNPNHILSIIVAIVIGSIATFCGQRPDIDASGLRPALAEPTNR